MYFNNIIYNNNNIITDLRLKNSQYWDLQIKSGLL